MSLVLVDSNGIIDVLTEDAEWVPWSSAALVINPIIYSEVSVHFSRVEELDAALPKESFRREPLPLQAGFLAGKSFLAYRKRGGARRSPLPDFYIGAHAAIRDATLLTRNATRYRSYFPRLRLIAP